MDAQDNAPAPLDRPGYFARVTRRDGPAIEQAMAGATLLDSGARLDGAVIEAAYAYDRPPLLKRLTDDRVPQIIDPQSLRFTGRRFLDTEALSRLPYAPSHRIERDDFAKADGRALAYGAMSFAQERGADVHLVPGLPLFDLGLDRWFENNRLLLEASVALNGSTDIDRKPILALVAPGAKALRDPQVAVDVLLDYPIDGVYVQPLRLHPTRDSLEVLARFVQFLAAIRQAGFPVVVGRVGAFGLVLQAMGIEMFDSGLGMAEAHDLASLNRPVTEREKARRAQEGGGGPSTRVYVEQLKTTLPAKAVSPLLNSEALRHHFGCTRGCCRFRALDELPGRARAHYLFSRRAEVDELAELKVGAMKLHQMEQKLRAARDLGAVVRRAFPDTPELAFDHIDRWLGLLAREQELAIAA